MAADPDLLAFRRSHYDLLVSLLWKEPSAALLSGLADAIEPRAKGAQALHPLLGAGWEAIGEALSESGPDRLAEAAADEHLRLFVGPRSPELQPYESHYLTGRVLDRPLAGIRSFLAGLGLEKLPAYPEPEDHLALELEVMRRLLARQAAAADDGEEARWRDAQAAFLREHLLVWGPAAARDLAAAPGARLYRGVGLLLEGFLALERDLVREWGAGEVLSLEDARRRLGASPDWRGPRFDLPAEPSPG